MATQSFKQKQRRLKRARKEALNKAPNIPKGYPWKILSAVYQDCRSTLPPSARVWLKHAISMQDTSLYLSFCDACSLQSMNRIADFPLYTARALRLCCCMEKFLFPGEDDKRDIAAIEKFLRSETDCRLTNLLPFPRRRRSSDLFDDDIFEHAKRFCAMVLGDKPDITDIIQNSVFGPGSNLSTKHGRTALADKFAYPITVTPDAAPLLKEAIMMDQRWLRSLLYSFFGYGSKVFEISNAASSPYRILKHLPEYRQRMFWESIIVEVNFNHVKTVPKNSKSSRDIAIEPAGNIFLQLGVNAVVRESLRTHGINIFSQTKNQELAKYGSETGQLATLDLRSASNLVSTSAVQYFVPPEWFKLFMELRSPNGLISMKNISIEQLLIYEKISSMGNGFTFVLETLLFSSLVYGVVKHHGFRWRDILPFISIYGDDIVVPVDLANDVMRVLNLSGFQVNLKKSFMFGEIRESCGKDYLRGLDIRGVHIEDYPQNYPDVIIQRNVLYEGFRRLLGFPPSNVVKMMDKWVHPSFRYYGPICENPANWLFIPLPDKPMVWHEDYQCWVWKIPRLRKIRSPGPLPMKIRSYFQILQAQLRGPTRSDEEILIGLKKSGWVEPPTNIFQVIGRNIPITIEEDTVIKFQWR